jgi:hypothetical protein
VQHERVLGSSIEAVLVFISFISFSKSLYESVALTVLLLISI